MSVRFAVQLPTLQCITTTVSDNNKQYRYISVLLLWSQILTGLLIYRKVFNAQNCTCGVGSKLLLIDVSYKCKFLCVWLCRRNMFHLCCSEHKEQLDYVWICLWMILKWTLIECRLCLAERT